MSISTPVAFLIFNRPDLTDIVFEAIRQAQPQKLLVVADGPRFPEEAEKCKKARSIIDRVDWDCEILTNFSEINMGCKYRVSSGIDWVFSEVEEAIILEDDCLPAPSFFYFCQSLLDRYRQDERIMMITGNNFQNDKSRTEYSYYFSKYCHIWGWASWQRAWQHYDVEMKTWSEFKKQDMIRFVCEDSYEKQYWTNVFDSVFNKCIDTWDYQWVYACWSQSGWSIIPNVNMVSNIGFGIDGTHTNIGDAGLQVPCNDVWEIKHPPFLLKDLEADAYTFDTHYGGKFLKQHNNFLSHTINRFKSTARAIKKVYLHRN